MLNRRDADFVYKLASSVPEAIKADDMNRAIAIFNDVAPRPGDANNGPNLAFLQLLRIYMMYSGWLVPRVADNSGKPPKVLFLPSPPLPLL